MTEKTVQKLSIELVPSKEEPLILRSHKMMIAYREKQYGTTQKTETCMACAASNHLAYREHTPQHVGLYNEKQHLLRPFGTMSLTNIVVYQISLLPV